ncbi:MAG: hypothetical protein HUU04_07460, partial [Verrucomicrobiae bacterium]|nr:hypothetical protein [Verrucomicrobiae bacterium]
MSATSPLNDAVIRNVVEEVLGRLGHAPSKAASSAPEAQPAASAPPKASARGGRARG